MGEASTSHAASASGSRASCISAGVRVLSHKLIPLDVQNAMPAAKQAVLLGHNFFPNLISYPMSVGLHSVFYLSLVMCLVAALASLLRGKAQIVTRETQAEAVQPSSVRVSNE